jgi:hypothetical protein
MLMAPNLRVVEPNNFFQKVPTRRPNAEMRSRKYLTPHEVEKLIAAASLGATATATSRWSSWPFATVCGPSRSPTGSGRRSNGVAIRRFTSAGRRMASPQFTLSGVMNCACRASCSGIRRVRSSSRLSAGVLQGGRRQPSRENHRRARQTAVPGSCSHAAPRLRLCLGQCGS